MELPTTRERMRRSKVRSATCMRHDGTWARWLSVAAVAVAVIALPGCEKYQLDRQMEELCKKDGGVKIYETITLSPAEYERTFKYIAAAKSLEDYYGREYRYVEERTVVAGKRNREPGSGRGQLARSYQAIYRRADGRLLGESTSYWRVGGDLVTFGLQPSANYCPVPRIDLAQSIFVRGN